MSLQISNISLPTSTRTVSSKYEFDKLVVGGGGLIETEVVDAAKVASKLTSALVAYRKRNPNDKRKYSVRTFKQADSSDGVGVWCVAEAPAAAPVAAPDAE